MQKQINISEIPTEKLQASAFMLGEEIQQKQMTIQVIRQELSRRAASNMVQEPVPPAPAAQVVEDKKSEKKIDVSKLPAQPGGERISPFKPVKKKKGK